MRRSLIARGIREILEARNGREATQVMAAYEEANPRGRKPAVVILELVMPEMDGFALLSWMRERECWLTVPAIVITKSSGESEVRRAHQLGCNSFVMKPSDPSELMFLAGTIREFWMRFHLSVAP